MSATTIIPRATDQGNDQDREHRADEEVDVHCDYISADEPIRRKFPRTAILAAVKQWAREAFVPNPPSDKAFYLSDERTHHRFTALQESERLETLGYTHSAHLRLHEEQVFGTPETT